MIEAFLSLSSSMLWHECFWIRGNIACCNAVLRTRLHVWGGRREIAMLIAHGHQRLHCRSSKQNRWLQLMVYMKLFERWKGLIDSIHDTLTKAFPIMQILQRRNAAWRHPLQCPDLFVKSSSHCFKEHQLKATSTQDGTRGRPKEEIVPLWWPAFPLPKGASKRSLGTQHFAQSMLPLRWETPRGIRAAHTLPST